MENNKLSQLEALLFLYGEPLDLSKIAKLLDIPKDDVAGLIAVFTEKMNADERGLTLLQADEKVQLVTQPSLSELGQKVIQEEFPEQLSPASLETLTIIAYAGPISRAEIDMIRGVNSSFIVRNLYIRGLVVRSADPKRGNVYLYNPSMDFLKFVGITAVNQLPEYQHLRTVMEKIRQQQMATQSAENIQPESNLPPVASVDTKNEVDS